MSSKIGLKRFRFKGWLMLSTAVFVLSVAAYGSGARAESNDAFCASCHTQNESTYVDRTQGPTVDLATAHASEGVRCIDCHSGKGVSGRLAAEMQGAQDAVVFFSGNDTQPHEMKRDLPDVNCTKCHGSISAERSFENHFHLFLPEWRKASKSAASCIDCHEGHPTDGDANIGFLNQNRTVPVCQSCHAFAGEG